MKLTIHERLLILDLLPKEGNIITLRIINDLRRELGFDEDQLEKFKIVQNEDKIEWDPKAEPMDIKIGEAGREIIAKLLKQLDENKKLTPEHVNLYEMFVEKK